MSRAAAALAADRYGRHSIAAGWERGIWWRPATRDAAVFCIDAWAKPGVGPLPELSDFYQRIPKNAAAPSPVGTLLCADDSAVHHFVDTGDGRQCHNCTLLIREAVTG